MKTSEALRALADKVPDTVGNQTLIRTMRELADQVASLEAFKASVDEALNSGDGTYRP